MYSSTGDFIGPVCIVVFAATILYFGLSGAMHNADIMQCNRDHEAQIKDWTDEQKTQTNAFCECELNHPAFQIELKDVTPREFKALRKMAYDTCFAKTMVF